MNWNKLKQQLESFLSPSLHDKVTYLASGYRYSPDKKFQCYMAVEKNEVFNTKNVSTGVLWYQNEQEVKSDEELNINVTKEDLEKVIKSSNGKIPVERLQGIARGHKLTQCSKDIFKAQNQLMKTDFQKTAVTYLSDSIENNLKSEDILINIFALVDRRVGKKRLATMRSEMMMKHPIVRYFYKLRCNS